MVKLDIVGRVPDVLAELTHDHGQLSVLVLEVGGVLGKIERGELSFDVGADALHDAAAVLRDRLLEHFGREEEGVFPFLAAAAPALAPRVAALRADHDAICERVEELDVAATRAARDGVGFASCLSTFERFEAIYAAHAREEIALLREIDAALEPAAKEELRQLLAAI